MPVPGGPWNIVKLQLLEGFSPLSKVFTKPLSGSTKSNDSKCLW